MATSTKKKTWSSFQTCHAKPQLLNSDLKLDSTVLPNTCIESTVFLHQHTPYVANHVKKWTTTPNNMYSGWWRTDPGYQVLERDTASGFSDKFSTINQQQETSIYVNSMCLLPNREYKIRKRKVTTLTKNWIDHGGQAHEHTHGNKIEIFWRTRPSFSIRREWILVVCSHTFAVILLRRTAVPVEIFQFCFRVCVCVPVHRDLFNFR